MSASRSLGSVFSQEEGRQLCRTVVRDHGLVPFDPHDFSLEAAAGILDGKDVLVRTACGSEKTGTIALIVQLMGKIVENPSLCKDYTPWFSDDPAIIVVCPTTALETDVEEKLLKIGIQAIALNEVVTKEAQRTNSTDAMWVNVLASRVILLSPEMLSSRHVASRLQLNAMNATKGFPSRASLLVVDEVHLLYRWGIAFRPIYRSIGQIRHCLPNRVRALLLSATLNPTVLPSILNDLGLVLGRDDLLEVHRSNLRPDIRVTTQTLKSNITSSFTFPEFRWVLGQSGITIIFIDNRSAALRIVLYLRRCDRSHAKYIRKYDSMNDTATYDAQTREMARDIPALTRHGLVIVTTSILTTGMDLCMVRLTINIEPRDLDEEIQREGHVNREKMPGVVVESYTYFKQATVTRAEKLVTAVDRLDASSPAEVRKLEEEHKITYKWASRILASCRSLVQNRWYSNPALDLLPCTCQTCPRTPIPYICICGGCKPGESMLDQYLAAMKPEDDTSNPVSETNEVLTTASQTIVRKHLRALEDKLCENEEANSDGLFVPGGFFDKDAVTAIVQNLLLIDNIEALEQEQALRPWPMPTFWVCAIMTTIREDILPDISVHHHNRAEAQLGADRLKEWRKLTAEDIKVV